MEKAGAPPEGRPGAELVGVGTTKAYISGAGAGAGAISSSAGGSGGAMVLSNVVETGSDPFDIGTVDVIRLRC